MARPLSANSGLMHRSEGASSFDHLIDDLLQMQGHLET